MNQGPYQFMPFFGMNPMQNGENYNNFNGYNEMLKRIERLEKNVKRLESRVYKLESKHYGDTEVLSKEYIKDDDELYMM